VQKQVIMCGFITFESFRATSPKFVTVMLYLCETTTKWPKLGTKDLSEKRSHLRFIFIFDRVCAEGSVLWLQALFNHIGGKQQ